MSIMPALVVSGLVPIGAELLDTDLAACTLVDVSVIFSGVQLVHQSGHRYLSSGVLP